MTGNIHTLKLKKGVYILLKKATFPLFSFLRFFYLVPIFLYSA
jgi:hypothetical protein